MDENPMNDSIIAARSRRPSRSTRVLLLVGTIAAFASVAVLAGPLSHNNNSGAWPARVAQLIRRSPFQRRRLCRRRERGEAGRDRRAGQASTASAEERAQLGASSAGRAVTSMGSGFIINARRASW